MLENLTYFLNGASLSFFAMGAFHMAIYARQSKSRPHYLFTICLIWMALIELKEFFLSHDAAYNYEILGPGFTFPDLFTLALLSLFFFELVMPGRITARYSLKLLRAPSFCSAAPTGSERLSNPARYMLPCRSC